MADMIVKYSIADAEIAKLASQYMPLAIADAKDKQGYEIVHAARMDVKQKRVMVEKTRIELKADALRYGKAVDAEAKRLTALLEPIEGHLTKQEEVYTAEIERQKAEKARAAAAKLQERISDLQAFGAQINLEVLRAMSDSDFAVALKTAADAWEKAEAERKRLAEETAKREAEMMAERERAAKAMEEARRIAQEAMAAQVAAEKATRDAQEAERAAAAKVQAEKDKAAAVERARIEEAERIKAEAEAKAQRAAEIAALKAENDRRDEELRPVMERIAALASAIETLAVALPFDPASTKAKDIVIAAASRLRALAEEGK